MGWHESDLHECATFGDIRRHKLPGQAHVNVNSIYYRLDDTGWCKLNSEYDLWYFYPYVEDKLSLCRYITDTPSGREHAVISYMERGVPRDTFAVDTIYDDGYPMPISLAWYKGELYMSGNINSRTKPEFSEILRYDETAWNDVGGGIHGGGFADVSSMLIWNDDLYVAGTFLESQGATGNAILRWDGKASHRLGDGLTFQGGYQPSVYGMVVFNNALYVAGAFDYAGDIPVPNIARWDGTKWCSVSDTFDPDSPLWSMAAYKNKLYIAGSFRSINGDSSFVRTAVWNGTGFNECSEPVGVETPSLAQQFSLSPNPATGIVHIRGAQNITGVRICDMPGRAVYESRSYNAQKGMDLSAVPPGMYIVQIGTSEGSTTLKLVKD